MNIGETILKLTTPDKLARPEIIDIQNRLSSIELQESDNVELATITAKGDLLAATGSGAVDNLAVGSNDQILVPDSTQSMGLKWTSSIAKQFAMPWLDYPLADTTNGSHFNDNTGSGTIPSGWTQTDAAQLTRLDQPYGFWQIVGASGETSWGFKKQTPFTIESLSANAWKSFWVGPLLLREGLYTADINYYFGVYRNNAGAIDTNTFARININWASASSAWQVRAERKDGTTQTNGTYYTLSRVPAQPIWLRVGLQNNTNKNMVGYMNGTPFVPLDMPLMSAAVGSGVTWGQVWWQFSMSRGAGNDDRILIGGIDYTADS